jgi:hypothetical protein
MTLPAHAPTPATRELVARSSGLGLPHESIAHLVGNGISDITLRKHYRQELDEGKARANLAIGGKLFAKAMEGDGDTACLIWWSKTQLRWSPPPALVEVSGLISISAALESATARIAHDAIDGTCEDVADPAD